MKFFYFSSLIAATIAGNFVVFGQDWNGMGNGGYNGGYNGDMGNGYGNGYGGDMGGGYNGGYGGGDMGGGFGNGYGGMGGFGSGMRPIPSNMNTGDIMPGGLYGGMLNKK
uniref:Uncharacterized protein n=1 Tax=Parastrongyloides trichosuri TaxID=131310 RepID=A0A0N5A3I5_PARTI